METIYFQPKGIRPQYCEAGMIHESDPEYIWYLEEPCKIIISEVKIIPEEDVEYDKKSRLYRVRQSCVRVAAMPSWAINSTKLSNYIKLNKMEETSKNNETAQLGIAAVRSRAFEYRVIDHDMFDEDEIRTMNSMGSKGWEIIRILEPMKWLNSDGMFVRIYYKREKQS